MEGEGPTPSQVWDPATSAPKAARLCCLRDCRPIRRVGEDETGTYKRDGLCYGRLSFYLVNTRLATYIES
jgi:hypothetical protein